MLAVAIFCGGEALSGEIGWRRSQFASSMRRLGLPDLYITPELDRRRPPESADHRRETLAIFELASRIRSLACFAGAT